MFQGVHLHIVIFNFTPVKQHYIVWTKKVTASLAVQGAFWPLMVAKLNSPLFREGKNKKIKYINK